MRILLALSAWFVVLLTVIASTRAAENRVRVGIDETRREHSAGAVDLARGTIPLAKSRLWTYLGDLLADDNDGGTR